MILTGKNRNARTFIEIVYRTSVPVSQTTQSMSIVKNKRLMTVGAVTGIYCEIHTKHGEMQSLLIL